jgi:hypothetical protein
LQSVLKPNCLPHRKWQLILKFIWKLKIAKTVLKRRKFNVVCFWHTLRHINKWTNIESSATNPHLNYQLIFKKYAQTIQCCKEQPFQQTILVIQMQKKKLAPYSHHMQKVTQNGLDLNVKAKINKTLRKKVHWNKSSCPWIKHYFLKNDTKSTNSKKKKIDKLDFIKIKTSILPRQT